MITIEIRMAQTGHSERVCLNNKATKSSVIFNHISDSYKVPPNDQLLITKIGTIIQQQQPVQKQLDEQKVDQTLNIQQAQQGQRYSYGRIPCIYFFNLKEINKSSQIIKPKSEQYWMDELQEKLKISKNLKSHIYQFKSFNPFFSCEKNTPYQNMVKRINDIRKIFIRRQIEYQNLKDIEQKIEQIVTRCQNQKKSVYSLMKSLQSFDQNIKQEASSIIKQKTALENCLKINDTNLQQNSAFLQTKYNLIIYFRKASQLKKKIDGERTQLREKFKQIKSKFRKTDEKVLQFGKNSIIKKLKQNLNANIVNYDNTTSQFEQFLKNLDPTLISKIEKDLKILQQNAQKQQLSDIFLGEEVLRQKYKQFSELNQQNRIHVKLNYQSYTTIKKAIFAYKQQVTQLRQIFKKHEKILQRLLLFPEENIQNDGINGNKQIESQAKKEQIFELTISCQNQLKRRTYFNKILNLVHSFINRKCIQEQALRKQFVQKNKALQNKNKGLLKNVKVPSVSLIYDQTTDLELLKFNKSSSELICYNSASIQQFVLSQCDNIRNIINNTNNQYTTIKIQNLKEIINKMSCIFVKVYDKKYIQLQQKNSQLSQTITNLEQNICNLENIILSHKNKILDLEKSIDNKQEEKIIRIRQFDQLKKEKDKCQKNNSDFVSLKKQLIKQAQINSTLCEQLAKYEQENQAHQIQSSDFEKLLNFKELQINRLNNELICHIKSKEQLQNQFNSLNHYGQDKNGIDLKLKVMQNFSKGTSQRDNKQIVRLNQQISYLQSQNQQLQDEYNSLSAEMRKIIMKQTQQKQIQTENQSKSNQFEERSFNQINNEKIIIEQDITIGQNTIFMPFSNNLYVGVTNNDQNKTLCNMNNVNATNYLLDFRCLHPTTKDLLNQCSFLVILKVTKISKEGKNSLVQGKIQYLLGFEDNSSVIKNYSLLLPSQ